MTISETRMGQPRYTEFMTLPGIGFGVGIGAALNEDSRFDTIRHAIEGRHNAIPRVLDLASGALAQCLADNPVMSSNRLLGHGITAFLSQGC